MTTTETEVETIDFLDMLTKPATANKKAAAPRPAPRPSPSGEGGWQAEMEAICEEYASMDDGRKVAAFQLGLHAGELVAAGGDPDEIEDRLTEAGIDAGLSEEQVRRRVRNGMRLGEESADARETAFKILAPNALPQQQVEAPAAESTPEPTYYDEGADNEAQWDRYRAATAEMRDATQSEALATFKRLAEEVKDLKLWTGMGNANALDGLADEAIRAGLAGEQTREVLHAVRYPPKPDSDDDDDFFDSSELARVGISSDANADESERRRNLPPSSWKLMKGKDAAANEAAAPRPKWLIRNDLRATFYPAAVNSIIGPSNSGKTFVAVQAMLDCLRTGGRVGMLDFETTAGQAYERMLLCAGGDEDLLDEWYYTKPSDRLRTEKLETDADIAALRDYYELFALDEDGKPPFDLVVMDGFNTFLGLSETDMMDNAAVDSFYSRMLDPVASTGVSVILVDHVPKNSITAGAIGAQTKRTRITGTTVKVTAITPPGRGKRGLLKLHWDKDKHGYVAGQADSDQCLGLIDFDATEPDKITLLFKPEIESHDEKGEWVPTKMMEELTKAMGTWKLGHEFTTNNLKGLIQGNVTHKKIAINKLIELNFIEQHPQILKNGEEGQALLHTLLAIYQEGEGRNRPVGEELLPTS